MIRPALAIVLFSGMGSLALAQTTAPSTPPATSAPAQTMPATPAQTMPSPTGPVAATLTGEQMYTSKIVGLNITNQEDKTVGEITDVAFTPAGVSAYIVSVGGFLGLGTRYVALTPGSVNVTWDAADKKWVARMQTTADQLKAAPEFKYPDT